MYLRYFGFDSTPFAVTPDPAFLYLSESHRQALAHLVYGAGDRGGFVALIGEVGTGKTTLIRALVENNTPDLDIALCWNPHLGPVEFVGTICDELGVNYDPGRDVSLKTLVDRLNAHLLEAHAANRRTVLVIDEAQNLSRDVLEQLRLLTNLETHKDKLLRVILVGQPELAELLGRYDLRQLAQRITARFTLRALGLAETRAYVRHRLERANGPQHLFSRPALVALRMLTRGVPRLINMVCERALMGAYAHGRTRVGPWTVARAAAETLPARARAGRRGRWWRLALPTGVLAACVFALGLAWLPDIPMTSAAEGAHSGRDATPAAGGSPAASAQAAGREAPAAPSDKSNDANHPDRVPNAHERAPKTKSSADSPPGTPRDKPDDYASTPEKNKTKSKNKSKPEQATPQSPEQPDKTDASADQARPDRPNGASTQAVPDGDADMNQLLRLWGVFGARIRAGCSQLHVGDLRCLSDTGTLDVLERYNRPALLILERDGKQQTVLLSAVNAKTLTLVGGDGTRDVGRARLLKLWTGRFDVVWRSEAGVRLIRPGSVGGAVVWLRRRLSQAHGQNPNSQVGQPSPVYDDALGRQLQAFQKSHDLKPDGIAGPRTQMMLNGAVPAPGAPSLRTRKPSEQ